MYPLNIFFNSLFKSASRSKIVLAGLVLAGLFSMPEKAKPAAHADSIMRVLQEEDFNRVLDRAIQYQHRADELERLAIEWRKEAERMDDPTERGRLQKRIIGVEDSMDIYTGLANEQFMILKSSLPDYVEKGGHPYLVKDTVISGITVYQYNLNEDFKAKLAALEAEAEESALAGTPESGRNEKAEEEIDEKAKKVFGNKDNNAGTAAIAAGSDFSIQDKPPYGTGRDFEYDFTIPPGVFYRIQLAVYRNRLPADHFGGLSPITTEHIPERELTRYFVGKFTRMEDAKKALDKVRALGYPDAFIIGYYNGKKSTFSKLKALEE